MAAKNKVAKSMLDRTADEIAGLNELEKEADKAFVKRPNDSEELTQDDLKALRDYSGADIGRAAYGNDARVIDELLTSIPKNQGYYLKLYREIHPNEFELKQRIDTYDSWSDLEWEINAIVRSYTEKAPQKWGSGRYRIIIWRDGGLRGPKYKPIDFVIDAGEPAISGNGGSAKSESSSLKEQVESLTSLVSMFRDSNPNVNPADLQKLLAETFKSGIEVSRTQTNSQDQAGNSALGDLAKVLGEVVRSQTAASVVARNQPDRPAQVDPSSQILSQILTLLLKERLDGNKRESPLEMLKAMKEAGLLPSQTSTNPNEQFKTTIEMMASMMAIVKSMGGGGDSGPVTLGAELVRTLGPQAGKMIEDVTSTVKTIINGRLTAQNKPTSKIPLPNNNQPPANMGKMGESLNLPGDKDEVQIPLPDNTQPSPQLDSQIMSPNPQVTQPMVPIFVPLYNAIFSNDVNYYPKLEELLLSYGSVDTYEQLITGKIPLDQLIDYVKPLGAGFLDDPVSRQYLVNFLVWAKAKKEIEVVAKCPKCDEEYIFDDKAALEADPKCPTCQGDLTLILGVTNVQT